VTAASGVIDRLLGHNHAAPPGDIDRLGPRPRLGLAIIACMDSRLDLFARLGLRHGDAHILRNAGGVVTDDVIRSLAVSQRVLGTTAAMLIHHTDCGLERLTDEEFHEELTRDAGVAPPFALQAFRDVDADVRRSIALVRSSPFLPHRDEVRGFVYDVDTGTLREVMSARDPGVATITR
jgi:carbonic anhydrase